VSVTLLHGAAKAIFKSRINVGFAVERGCELVYRQRAVVRNRQQAGLETKSTRTCFVYSGKFEKDLARLSASSKTAPALTEATESEQK
jgi:hypothetical protein